MNNFVLISSYVRGIFNEWRLLRNGYGVLTAASMMGLTGWTESWQRLKTQGLI